jgi:hypothetical protein
MPRNDGLLFSFCEKLGLANQTAIKKNQATILKNQAAVLRNQSALSTIIKNQKEILTRLNK